MDSFGTKVDDGDLFGLTGWVRHKLKWFGWSYRKAASFCLFICFQ